MGLRLLPLDRPPLLLHRRGGHRSHPRLQRTEPPRLRPRRQLELDLRGVLGYTDYFVICSGNTDRQTKAIHDRIHQGLKKEHGLLPRRVEGLGEARWILLDYLDVVVHVFTPEAREFYGLERLWGEVPARAVG